MIIHLAINDACDVIHLAINDACDVIHLAIILYLRSLATLKPHDMQC